MRILCIEDDEQVLDYIVRSLGGQGHHVAPCSEGIEGLQKAKTENYDLAIIDRMLPGLDGISIIQNLRASGSRLPVIILSALGEVDDKVSGLRAGGDDYLVKPFAFEELLARIEVLGRRANVSMDNPSHLLASGLDLDLIERRVSRDGITIDLLTREFRLLEQLMRHKGQVVTRAMLLESVWDYNFDPQTNIIDVHISRLRGKIDKGFEKQLIKTVRGAGYIVED
ncbi:MAG: DNA-binding response regulator [Micavibrio aeruginosavorus]|uniref:DNA-binding response regulator n=1 Tax=Micavibrio aeruginosavorus TaxID=349221 RepID=A0A2W5FMT1_9BACT|nr:MAG: DNA-binding response regulator [Micavibrio aeruginosavorus]